MKLKFTACLILFCSLQAMCQKYNFVNWTVEDGLIQSQAIHICQDKFRQLWIATEGGLCKFDGKKFTGYAMQDGVSASRVNSTMCDKDGNIWAGTEYGLSVFNGSKFKKVALGKNSVNNVGPIVQTPDGTIYTTDNFKIYRVTDFKSEVFSVTNDSTEIITSLYKTRSGDLLASVHKKGIFLLKEKNWQKIIEPGEENRAKYVRTIFITSASDTLFASNGGLLHSVNGKMQNYFSGNKLYSELNPFCIEEDAKKSIWIGSDKGAYKIEGKEVTHFNSKKGFTDNSVFFIFRDVENNLWFATDADGIFKFRENTFTYYDKSSGLSNPIIMGVVETTNKNLFLAGYGGGLYKINSRSEIESVKLNNSILEESKINSLYADDLNNIWIGTLGKGAWKYNEKTGLKKVESKNAENIIRGGTCFLKDATGNILIGNTQGLFLYDKNENIVNIKMPTVVVSVLKQYNNDTILVGTSKGIYILDKNYNAKLLPKSEFENSSILCLAVKNKHIWVGTTDRGLLNWDLTTNKIIYYNTSNGLPSNFIYSIYVSDKQTAWVGTGFGISNLLVNGNGEISAIKNYGRADGLLGMECNHNSILCATDSGLWFGTTKGLFHFNPYSAIVENNQPFVLLKSVKLFSSEIKDSTLCKGFDTWFNIPKQLKLKAGQNHLTFELNAIYFTNPEDILYKYKLEGIDTKYTISSNPVIVYPSLPPGKYTLKIQALTKSGVISANSVDYAFEIDKVFYQTRFFQLLAVIFLVSMGAIVAYWIEWRKRKEKEVLQKIREEEFMKLRQRTAEDFHDEMGNKLTRISILTDILKSKVDVQEGETHKLVNQIKENTNALYSGSRDIIWSLNAQNDGIYEIVEHIRDKGIEIFHDTAIELDYVHNVPSNGPKLKLDYSRNLIMVFKEIYNNILKHAHATKVRVHLNLTSLHELEISIHDNGIGFPADIVQKGNGIKNIKNRINRMNGEVTITSSKAEGTEIKMILKDIFTEDGK
jgi:signal transduction histidine kinase/ligand-binding sensor domain-containing protein